MGRLGSVNGAEKKKKLKARNRREKIVKVNEELGRGNEAVGQV